MAIAILPRRTTAYGQRSVPADFSFGVGGVAKPEWGSKRVCLNCGARFYDMNRTPIVCPACETVFDPAANSRPRRMRAPAKAPAAAAASSKPAPSDNDEVETDDEIAVGDKQWKKVLGDFYADFRKQLSAAEHPAKGMRANAPTETNIPCPQCGRPMQIRTASTGVFLGCSGYALPRRSAARARST